MLDKTIGWDTPYISQNVSLLISKQPIDIDQLYKNQKCFWLKDNTFHYIEIQGFGYKITDLEEWRSSKLLWGVLYYEQSRLKLKWIDKEDLVNSLFDFTIVKLPETTDKMFANWLHKVVRFCKNLVVK